MTTSSTDRSDSGAASEPQIEALCAGHSVSDSRRDSLAMAIALGASPETLTRLRDARRLARKPTIVLPAHRLEGLSRGSGWARLGRGATATWGERVDGGYRVGPGRWTVGGSDGFSRKGEDVWVVSHVSVGPETWTVAS